MTLPARVEVRTIGPDDAAALRAVILPAFDNRPPLDPPAEALRETEEDLAELLSHHGGVIATFEGEDVGGLVLDPVGTTMYVRRFGVALDHQGHGVGRALIDAAVEAAQDYEDLTVVAREELPRTIQFWERQGFREIRRHSPNVELRRPLKTFIFDIPDADAMRELGRDLASGLEPGDLVVLTGDIGAGKTTFTQGLGEALEVRGPVTSPTFVIAREHPPVGDGGVPLVHVDAYRLGGVDELDSLDLDTSLDEAVTVVEWGEGMAEGLAESRLELRIIPALVPDEADTEPRRVLMTPIGPRWHDLDVPDSERPPLAEKVNESLLLDWHECEEAELADLDPAVPLELSVVTAMREGECLLVRNIVNGEWELSGGPIRAGESAREAMLRRFEEEVGESAAAVGADPEFIGVATVQLGHARRIISVACYRIALTRHPADPPREISWWPPHDMDEVVKRGISPIDAHIADLSADPVEQ